MKEIRVGIIGCGKIANVDHIPGFLAVDGVTVTALCDPVDAAVAKTRSAFPELAEAEGFSSADALIASGKVDAVAICTPNNLHHSQTLAACRAGLHVLCDKPMAADLESATEMIEAARSAGVILQINQSLRYNPTFQAVVKPVSDGKIGKPIHVRCIRACDGTPNEGWSPGADWFVSSANQGGLLLDIGIHMADVMRMIMGDAEKVAGLIDSRRPDIDVPDNVNALFRYCNGGTGVLELSWTLPGGAGFFEVYGTEGRVRMGFGEKPIELWRKGETEPEITYPEPVEGPDSQAAFCEAVRGGRPSPTAGEYGRRALALCTAIAESNESGRFAEVQHFPGDEAMT